MALNKLGENNIKSLRPIATDHRPGMLTQFLLVLLSSFLPLYNEISKRAHYNHFFRVGIFIILDIKLNHVLARNLKCYQK